MWLIYAVYPCWQFTKPGREPTPCGCPSLADDLKIVTGIQVKGSLKRYETWGSGESCRGYCQPLGGDKVTGHLTRVHDLSAVTYAIHNWQIVSIIPLGDTWVQLFSNFLKMVSQNVMCILHSVNPERITYFEKHQDKSHSWLLSHKMQKSGTFLSNCKYRYFTRIIIGIWKWALWFTAGEKQQHIVSTFNICAHTQLVLTM